MNPRLVEYPAALVGEYRAAGLWGSRTIADEFHAVATAHPDRPAVVAQDGRRTYRELDEHTDRLAAGLAARGLGPGDPVLFQVTNRLASVVAWYGALKAGWCRSARWPRTGATRSARSAVVSGRSRTSSRATWWASPANSGVATRPCARCSSSTSSPGCGADLDAGDAARPSRGSRPGSIRTAWPSSSSPAARPGCRR